MEVRLLSMLLLKYILWYYKTTRHTQYTTYCCDWIIICYSSTIMCNQYSCHLEIEMVYVAFWQLGNYIRYSSNMHIADALAVIHILVWFTCRVLSKTEYFIYIWMEPRWFFPMLMRIKHKTKIATSISTVLFWIHSRHDNIFLHTIGNKNLYYFIVLIRDYYCIANVV